MNMQTETGKIQSQEVPDQAKEQFLYALHLADNALMMSQRNAEWTGHGPVLEQDIAITNIALDHLGQARNFYQLAASLYEGYSPEKKNAVNSYLPRPWKNFNRELMEDDLAFLRDEHQFLNLLITELPRGDWAFTVLRQFFFSAFQWFQYKSLEQSHVAGLVAIAEKSLKEVTYHLRWSGEWVIRLGDGTDESNQRISAALEDLWMFTGEMFEPSSYELINPADLRTDWMERTGSVFSQAGLTLPAANKDGWFQKGGKEGRHTEYMGYLLAEMQHLQRTYPNSTW